MAEVQDSRRRKFYDQMSESFDLGSFDEFDKKMNDAGSRRRLYDAIDATGIYDIGDFNYFDEAMKPTDVPQQQPQQQQPQNIVPIGGDGYTFTAEQLEAIDRGGVPVYVPGIDGQRTTDNGQVQQPAQQSVDNGQRATGNGQAEAPKYGSQAWMQQRIADEAENPYAGKTRQEAIQDLRNRYLQNLGKPIVRETVSYDKKNDPTAVADRGLAGMEKVGSAQNLIEQAVAYGVVDTPSEAARLARDVRNATIGKVAQQRVDALLQNFKPGQFDPGMFDELFNSREVQMAIAEDLKNLGMDDYGDAFADEAGNKSTEDGIPEASPAQGAAAAQYLASRDQYYQLLRQKLEDRLVKDYGYLPSTDARSHLHQASSAIGNADEHDEHVKSREAFNLTVKYAEPEVAKYFDEARKKESQLFQKATEGGGFAVGMTGYGPQMIGAANYAWDEARDPEKIWAAMEPSLKQIGANIANNPDFIKEAEAAAEEQGVDLTTYMEYRVLPVIEASIQQEFERMAVEQEMPQGILDYAYGKMRESLIGNLLTSAFNSQARRRAMQRAMAMTEAGTGKYKPGIGARIVGGVSSMAPDLPLFGIVGKAVQPVGTAAMQTLTDVGMRPLVSRLGAASLMGGSTMGGVESLKGGVEGAIGDNDYEHLTDDKERSILNILGDAVKGSIERGVPSFFSGLTMVGGPLGQKISNGRGVIGNLLGWGTQVGVDATGATAVSVLRGDVDWENVGEHFAENVGTFAALGAKHKAKEFKALANGGRSWNGVEFTKGDIKKLEDLGLDKFRRTMQDIQNAGKKGGLIEESMLGADAKEEQRQAAASEGAKFYNNMMRRYDVDRDLKVKVAQSMGAPIPDYAVKPAVIDMYARVPAASVDLGLYDVLEYEYNFGIAEKLKQGMKLDDYEYTVRLLFQENKAYSEAMEKLRRGETLTNAEKKLIDRNLERFATVQREYFKREHNRINEEFEKDHGLEAGTIDKMMQDVAKGKAVDNEVMTAFEEYLRGLDTELKRLQDVRDGKVAPAEAAQIEQGEKAGVEASVEGDTGADETSATTPSEPETLTIDGKRYVVFPVTDEEGQLQRMRVEVDEAGRPMRDPEPISENDYVNMQQASAAKQEEAKEVQQEQQQEQPAAPVNIPVDEKGRPQYEQATAEDTVAALTNKHGKEKARQLIEQMAANTARAFEELQAKDTSKITDITDLEDHDEALKKAGEKAKYWNDLLKAEQEKDQAAAEAQAAEEPVAPVEEPVVAEKPAEEAAPIEPVEAEQPAEPVAPSEPIAPEKPAERQPSETEQKLRKQFKVKVGDVPLIDVLTEEEQQQLLDAHERGDKEAIGNLTGDFIDKHQEDLIMKGRDNRNSAVERAMKRSNKGERLRLVRKQYQGIPDAEAILEDEAMKPTTLEEYVADLLGEVPKPGNGVLAYYSYDKGGNRIVGLKDESGYGSRGFNGDTKGFNPWLAPNGKGISLKSLAENLHEMLPEEIKNQFDDQDVRNALLNVFSSAEKPTDIANYILRDRINQAEIAARRMEDDAIERGNNYQKVSPNDKTFAGRLTRAKQQTNTNPTDGQKKAGNYKKGHVSFGGYDFVIENPEGSTRKGENNGRRWEHKMNNTYGYILGKRGKDGDQLDMYINDDADLDNFDGKVYVIDQVDPKTGKFDEHKVMYGFDSEEAAREAYLSNYEKGWKGLGKITGVDKAYFDRWLDSSKRKFIPFAEHSIAKYAEWMSEKKGRGATAGAIDTATRNKLIDISKKGGVDISTDAKEGQETIDEYYGIKGDDKEKPMYFKIPGGKVYGYTYKGKIYIDPRIATSETPIHEYSHLWAQMKRKASPEEWNQIKDVLLNDKVVQPFIDKVKEEYKELDADNRSDEFVEEVLTQFSGRHGAEKLREMAEKIKQEMGNDATASTVAEAAIRRVKSVLNAFWKSIADMMGWKYTNAEEIADKILSDMLNGKSPREELRKALEKADIVIGGAFDSMRPQKVSKEDKPIFVSNALRALDGIKQDKATPEQWLKMIEKQGGLKVAEDKWLGLSEWLKGQDKKSITKQDVLDFIRQNQIQVEEVHYGEGLSKEAQQQLDDFNEEFRDLMEEGKKKTNSPYPDEWAGYAYQEMHERYGDDFYDAFEQTGRGKNIHLTPTLDWNDDLSGAAKYFLNINEDTQQPINNTRLEYTTKGLDNKKEIALTVPTIDAWNKHDELHFGDAGGGRAVAWVRFGDTTTPRKNPEAVARYEAADEAWNDFGNKMYDKYGADYSNKLNAEEKAQNQQLLDEWNAARDALNKANDYDRVLVIDEIQSKRHQEARDRGYKPTVTAEQQEAYKEARKANRKAVDEFRRYKEMLQDKYGKLSDYMDVEDLFTDPDASYKRWSSQFTVFERANYEVLQDEMKRTSDEVLDMEADLGLTDLDTRVPDAPFEKNWHELAMKRMLRYAAENGYDKIAWTTGRQQGKRYALSNKIEDFYYHKNEDGTYDISAVSVPDINGHRTPYDYENVSEKDLTKLVGKDIATKMLEGKGRKGYSHNERNDWTTFKARELKMGDEGMRGFYDDILPRFVNKYGKKWGIKVGEVDLPNLERDAQKMWSVDVTPEMKEGVMEGQPMFQKVAKDDEKATQVSKEEKPIFISNALKAVEGITQEKATPEQWLKMIEKGGGLKAGEDKWLGLSDWLQTQDKKTITKQDVLDYIRKNQIQVEEVNYGDVLFTPNSKINLESSLKQGLSEGKTVEDVLKRWDTLFDEKTLNAYKKGRFTVSDDGTIETDEPVMSRINETRLNFTTDGLDNKKEIVLTVPTIEPWNEHDDIHFGEAGEGRAVAWARFGDYTDADGKKVLVIDEIQSKRHQEGREKGYKDDKEYQSLRKQQRSLIEEKKEVVKEILHRQGYAHWEELEPDKALVGKATYKWDPDLLDKAERGILGKKEEMDKIKSINSELDNVLEKILKVRKAVPDAPFDKNWHELVMKRMLRYAAENGYDKIAWTDGARQARRYDIGAAVRSIDAGIDVEGTRVLMIHPRSGRTMVIEHDDEGNITKMNAAAEELFPDAKKINEVVGKDIALGALRVAGRGTENMRTWRSDDLRVGAEGMKGFYDDMLPRYMNKYGKKWGVKVSEENLSGLQGKEPFHVVDVTPEMKESVMEGQPMFQKVSKKDEPVELNVATAKDKESRDYVRKVMADRGFTQQESDEIIGILDSVSDQVMKIAEKYPAFKRWQETGIVDKVDPEAYDAMWRIMDEKLGWIPNRSAFKKNGEYPLNIDLGALCTKREAMDALVQIIADQGGAQNLGPTQIEALKDLLKEEGFLTACDICFVETKRARAINDANKFAYEWQSVLEGLGITDDVDAGKRESLTEEQIARLAEMTGKDYEKAFNKYIPKERRRTKQGKKDLDSGLTASKMKMIANLMLEDYSLAGRFNPEWLLTTRGTDWLFRTYGPHTSMSGVLADMFGTSTAKPLEGFNIYDPLSWKRDFDAKRYNEEGIYAIGGVRGQSFTDFNPIMFLDYVQMFSDLAIRRLPMHMYTKVPSLIKLFGETGTMLNMSLVPAMVKGVDKAHAGLKPDGKGGWDYAWADESFPVDEAMELRKRKEFGGRVGTIAVGVSDEHIRKMLDDKNIDMIIPYHKSGMPKAVQVKTGLKDATDYTDVQNTQGAPKSAHFNYNEQLQAIGDPRKTAQAYLDWCDENGYTPKFPQFRDHKNYYKLLEDFRGYDGEGNPVLQGPVRMKLTEDWQEQLDAALADRGDTDRRIGEMKQNKRLMEKANKLLQYQRLDGEVRTVMMKRLGAVLGEDNVQSLRQEEFFDALESAYAETMGEAEAHAKVEVLRGSDGRVYGFAHKGKVTFNENLFNANTPAHEFTHVWVKVAQKVNPKRWAEGKELLKQSQEWQEVLDDPLYKDIRDDEDAVGSEVLSRIVGKLNEDFVRSLVDPSQKQLKGTKLYGKILDWLREFFKGVRSVFGTTRRDLTFDEFIRMPMKDLWDETSSKRFREAVEQLRDEEAASMVDTDVEMHLVEDKDELERLEKEPKEIGYRNVVLNEDGTLGSPMANRLGKKGEGRKATSAFEWGKWERSDEHPELANENGKIDLIKPDGKPVGGVDYNPYIHIRPDKVNKQFKQAWERPNLIYVETEYPASELNGEYKADKAAKSVGKHKWGTQGESLILSRWDKPVRQVPWDEVADDWVKAFKDRGVEFDIVPPKLLPILAERGVEILPPHKGMGKACNEAYEAWKSEQDNAKPKDAVERLLNEVDRRRDIKFQKVGDEEAKKLDDIDNIKPIGKGDFGDIYDQFKGKPKEAVDFLVKKKGGDLLGVFHRDEIGDIDLVWGESHNPYKGKGLSHIIKKHIETLRDFKNVDELSSVLDDVVNNGNVGDNGNNIEITKDGYRVVLAQENSGKKWVLTAFDNNKTKKEKLSSANTAGTPIDTYGSRAVAADDNLSSSEFSEGKGRENISNIQEKTKENAAEAENSSKDAVERLLDEVDRRRGMKFQLAGKKGAEEADKADEDTRRMDNQRIAEEMEKAGKDAKAIWLATGWEKDKNGKWRFEIPDVTIKNIDGLKKGEETTLGDIVTAKELFDAYPDLKDVKVDNKAKNDDASYDGSIHLSESTLSLDEESVRSALTHEIQHAIQEREGWEGARPSANLKWFEEAKRTYDAAKDILKKDYTADEARELRRKETDPIKKSVYAEIEVSLRQGSTMDEIRQDYGKNYGDLDQKRKQAVSDYVNASGEVEARNAQNRLSMSEEERRNTPPSETEDGMKFQRVPDEGDHPDPELTPEERQYWKKYEEDMQKWKERNGIPSDAEEPKVPVQNAGESSADYMKRMMQYLRQRPLWQTAPRLDDYRQMRQENDDVRDSLSRIQKLPNSYSEQVKLLLNSLQRIRGAVSRQKTYDKATVKAVTDFAQDFMRLGFGDNLGRGDIERLLSNVKNAVGAPTVKKQVDNILNILMDNYLRNLENRIVKLSSVKELKQTAQGVEAQGKLELKGQRMIQAYREARQNRMTAEQIRERMTEVAEKMARNDEEAPMWEQEYEGLSIALQYVENIDASRSEWGELDAAYNDAVAGYQESGRSYQAQQQLLEAIEKAMMENKQERIGMYGEIIGRLEGNISESMRGAKEFVEREKERINFIHSIANLDLAGKDMGAMRENEGGKPANFFLQPLATFEQMLRQFGAKNASGEGWLYNHFMRSWADSTDRAYENEVKAKEELDEKARSVFGDKIKRWSDLYKLTRNEKNFPGVDVTLVDQGEPKEFHLTQGNALYIYMANKMTDGAMKLRKMGITEEDVEAIKNHLDPRLVELGDWLQDDYLVRKRTEYNKVHERMFGAPMSAIDHYFPIKILGDARVQEQDVANMADQDAVLPSTITGNIIKRRRNTLPLDILHTDALSLAIEHVEDMERWAATAEWNKDINTLLSYTTFRNKVKNMKTIYGSGKALWDTFADTARMAAGTYRPKAKAGSVDKAVSNIAKGVTAAKINFRVYTAFKQILSAPAFLHDVDLRYFVKNSVNPKGSWDWAMENMPMFRKRWKSRQVGDTRLMDDPTDWKMWKNNVVQMATRLGMTPNGFVDGVTCAVGARSIYESRLKKYKEMGMEDAAAKKRALQDAEIGYNLTQQSSEGAFVSRIQKDRTVAANALSVFRNASMAYTRQWVDAARNLKHRTQRGYKQASIEFMAKQFEDQMGLTETEAREAAEKEYARAGRHDVARMLNMMFGVTVAWNLGASLPYLLIGDDDDTKKAMLTDALLKGLMSGPSEGFASGNLISDLVGRSFASEETRKVFREKGLGDAIDAALKQAGDYEINPLPLLADIQSLIDKMGYDKFAAAQDLFNICMQASVGVNPQTFTDMWNACIDYGNPSWMPFTDKNVHNDDLSNAKEIALFILRVMNAPKSSWQGKYIDELGIGSEDAGKLSYNEMARRYANYKHWKDAPIFGWLRGDEERLKKMETIRKQFDKAVQERINRLDEEGMQQTWENIFDLKPREMMGKELARRAGFEKPAEGDWYMKNRNSSKKDKESRNFYVRMREWGDINEDLELEKILREAKAAGDDVKAKEAQRVKDIMNKWISLLGSSPTENQDGTVVDEAYRWQQIRQARREGLERLRQTQQ